MSSSYMYKDFLTIPRSLSFMFPMAIVVQNFIIKTFLIKVGALGIISSLSQDFSPLPFWDWDPLFISPEMEQFSNAHMSI